jgi:serine/threonine-protein kinase
MTQEAPAGAAKGPDTTDFVPEAPEDGQRRQVGAYLILQPLGKGGQGQVFKAQHLALGRTVVLKMLPPERNLHERAICRLKQEMKAGGKLDHENVVRTEYADDGPEPFLVMEWIDGINLQELVRDRQAKGLPLLAVADACELARQAACGLAYVHGRGLVHRDVKPSNLMLSTSGVVKVLDFGLALLPGAAAPQDGAGADGGICCTPDYAAPEHLNGSMQVDARADLYSLGCTLYFLLTGALPFEIVNGVHAKLKAHRDQPLPPIRERRTDVPDELAAVLDRLVAKDPGKRFATAEEAARALEPFAARPRRRGWRVTGVLLAAALLVGLTAAVLVALRPGTEIGSDPPSGSGAGSVPQSGPLRIVKFEIQYYNWTVAGFSERANTSFARAAGVK